MCSVTRTSFDMDPFVVASLGKKVLRTKIIRHNLNPVYDEKMVFQVMKHETSYSFGFNVVDRDKLSGNDFICSTTFPIQKLVQAAPQANPETGLYPLADATDYPPPASKENKSRFKIPLSRSSSSTSLKSISRPAAKQSESQITLQPSPSQSDLQRETVQPNNGQPDGGALGRHASESETASRPFGEDPHMKPYMIPLELKHKDRWEAKHAPHLYFKAKFLPYRALRQQFWRAMLRQYDADDSSRVSKIELTTMLDTLGSTLHESTIDGFFQRFTGENADADTADLTFDQAVICLEDQLEKHISGAKTESAKMPTDTISNGEDPALQAARPEGRVKEATNVDKDRTAIPAIITDANGEAAGGEGRSIGTNDLQDDREEEHIVEIRECPICHQPRLDKRSDADIITHIATCASSDWRQVNNLVMGGFVTSSQAQRKWYSKVITKIGYGGYKLGANSANILVQDRITGQINEERMSVYVRLGIRLLYKALGSKEMEKKRST